MFKRTPDFWADLVHNDGGFEKKKMAGAAGAIAKTGEMLLHTAQGGDVQAACLMDRKSWPGTDAVEKNGAGT